MNVTKTIILNFLFISSLFGIELDWIHDYDKALEVAKKEKKDVYLFIGADVCRFCTTFKKNTLSKKFVMDKLNENFVPLYLSRDRHKVPDRFEKFGVPRHYFLDENGKIIVATFGSYEPAGFFNLLDEVDLVKED